MKKSGFFFKLLSCLIFVGTAHAAGGDKSAVQEEVNLREPPFWMASYDEFKNLQQFQKDFYLEKLGPEIRKIPTLENTTQGKLTEAAEWYKSWDGIAKKLYIACRDKKLEKDCDRVAEIRLATFSLLSNQKEANRQAESPKSEKKTK